jgi:hypothetical protein
MKEDILLYLEEKFKSHYKNSIYRTNMTRRFYLLKDVWAFMKERKKWWLLPIVIMLLIGGIFIIVVQQSTSTLPFIYALF